jgi:ectoine hydroxylase-related dioxygenase (phytanoyl-CoA dioxygenase family)
MSVSPIPIAKRIARSLLTNRYVRQVARVLTPAQRALWDEQGFLVLPGHFTRAEIEAINRHVDDIWQDSRKTRRPTVVDIFIGSPQERRTLLSDAPLDARKTPYKLNDLYLESDTIRGLILEERLGAILEELLDGAPLVCNTLNLEFGSQQRDHTDSLYMSGGMDLRLVASWIALEDGSPDSGPLRYYAGSHRIPPYLFSSGKMDAIDAEMPAYTDYMKRETERRGLAAQTFVPKIGDVFIWHSQLFHGGEPIRNKALTRRSLVTHYWRAQDIARLHGRVRPGRYFLKRAQQPVDAAVDDH